MSDYPKEGQAAPDFELQSDRGSTVKLSDLRGKKVVLYFYPKDNTPGCTAQACDLRDRIQEFDARGALVFGLSPDDVKSHVKFRDKYSLPFPLLADVGHKVAEQYGVWVQKNMLGRKYMGVERTSFIIDEQGRIAKVLPKVKFAEHAEQVLGLI
ncbi:MAG: thioredoxin-dependent thiol peroxidase [Gemmatimonadota bacterium]